jgi:hypothetical protein
MNFAPKVGPLVAELLSGVTALLIIYFDFHGFSFKEFDELTSGALVVLVVVAWIIGTFFDTLRNHLEWLWDSRWFAEHELNWAFFFRGDQKRLANLDQYFWSFYVLDADMVLAIFLSLAASVCILGTKIIVARRYTWLIWALLLFIAAWFANDARLLRREIKKLLDEETT